MAVSSLPKSREIEPVLLELLGDKRVWRRRILWTLSPLIIR